MKRPSNGLKLLHDLLDRHERGAGATRRIIARPSQIFASSDERDSLYATLRAARDAGAVSLADDRDAPHLIASVTLTNADTLYAHLARTPAAIGTEAALARLADFDPATETGTAIRQFVIERWGVGKRALGIGPDKVDDAMALIAATDAAMSDLPGAGIALRTRSARLLGDSKALERALPKIVAFLRLSGRIAADLSLREAARALGLEKFPQPVLVAGPLAVDGASIATWAYAGLPPEASATLAVKGNVRSILTIENLECFNRHVRECREVEDVVVYTGGFPALGVVSALLRLITRSKVSVVHHWGDIDPGGVRIGAYLERILPVPVRPHLMSIAIAESHGRIVREPVSAIKLARPSAFAELAAYLAAPGACFLEQEVIDPIPVAVP